MRNQGIVNNKYDNDSLFPPEEFNNYFSSIYTKNDTNVDFNSIFNDTINNDNKFSFNNIDELTVEYNIFRIKSNGIGDDGISIRFIKKLIPLINKYYLIIFNACLTKSYFPKKWKMAIITPILKVPSSINIEDNRPISGLCASSKILEYIMYDQIMDHLNSNKLLHTNQSGFRMNHSTTTSLTKINHVISSAVDNNKIAVVILADFRKAFDLVDHKIFIEKLYNKFNFSSNACKLLISYLTERYQKVNIKGASSNPILITSGTPQGSIISPIDFSMFINDIFDIIKDINLLNFFIDIDCFADDTQLVIIFKRKFLNESVEVINKLMDRLSSWCDSNKIKINETKTVGLAINLEENKMNFFNNKISINNKTIEFVSKARNLGLIMNNEFNWNDHVDKICNNIKFKLHMLRKSQKLITTNMKAKLVKTIIIPKFLYCCNIYSGTHNYNIDKLTKTFNSCIRYIHNHLKPTDHVSEYTIKLLGCTFEQFLLMHSLIFLHRILHRKTPEYLFNKLVFQNSNRSKFQNYFHTINYKTELGSFDFFTRVIKEWNSLPLILRNEINIIKFKENLLAHFNKN